MKCFLKVFHTIYFIIFSQLLDPEFFLSEHTKMFHYDICIRGCILNRMRNERNQIAQSCLCQDLGKTVTRMTESRQTVAELRRPDWVGKRGVENMLCLDPGRISAKFIKAFKYSNTHRLYFTKFSLMKVDTNLKASLVRKLKATLY